MFGFPSILNGNAGVKLSNNADSGFPKPIIGETFYSIKDGIWSDTSVWQTASGRVGLLPTANDDVYVRNVVNVFGQNATFNCNNLFIIGALNFNAFIGTTVTLIVNGNINSIGTINLNGTGFQNILSLLGANNYISNLTTGSIGIVQYARIGNQDILDLPYSNLVITNAGIKKPTNNLTITGNLTVSNNAIFDLWWYDLTVSGTTSIQGGGTSTIKKSYFGNIIFIGNVTFGNGLGQCDFRDGNPNIEFRGGFGIATSNPNVNSIYTGTGTWTFTTNNQSLTSWSNGFPINLDANFIIANGITVTVASSMYMQLSGTINGAGLTSKLLMASTAVLNFATLASVSSMTVGTWDFTTNANTIQYNGNYSATIPSYFTTFSSLTIGGTGTKTLGVNTTVNGNLSALNGGYLECSIYNFTINGTTNINTGGLSVNTGISKNGAGNILFVGNLTTGGGATAAFHILSFTGNPTIEWRGGFTFNGMTLTSGTGQWKFSTNSQTIFTGTSITLNCPILISGAITVTATNTSIFNINNSIDGDNVSSTLDNRGPLYFINSSYTAPMTTFGTFIYNVTSTSTIGYAFNGNYTLPYTSYQGLYLRGTGTKSLSGNTTISQTFTANDAGYLECSTYNLTINGATSISSAITTNTGISKTGAGTVTFGGTITTGGGSTGAYNILSFTGNPNIEMKGSVTINGLTLTSGTGQLKISSAITMQNNGLSSLVFNNSVLISGAIVVSFGGPFTIVGVLNGDNASSTYRALASSTLTYNNATQPMATGILDTSTNLNTWIYGSGNQNIKGGPSTLAKQVYRNLTLNGGGTKTLQGFVSVQNTYTLTAPATLALNGFTLTNP